MSLLPLQDLIVKKPTPLLTLELLDAFQNHPQETVETYIFTDTIRHHFDLILDVVARGHGQGFWVQAEYGSGKTHFLATLAALLADTSNTLWEKANSPAIRQFRQRLRNTRLLPVVFSLRGEASTDALNQRSLMDVLLEKGFSPAIERAGLGNCIQLTPAQELMNWYDKQAAPVIQNDLDAFVRAKSGISIKQLREREGNEAAAQLMPEYFARSGFKPSIDVSVKDRLASIYRQVTAKEGAGYTGILVIIDEYEGWSNIRNMVPEARAQDEDLLETLGYILPKDLGLAVHTIVASQSAIPAKLHGGQEGDRYIRLGLLAGAGDREYDIIASRRVRQLNADRLPEIDDYYRYYRETFNFARGLSQSEFQDTFPFQPRCFEIVRHITSRELPGPRSGIMVLYETLHQDALLKRNMLIRASDLMTSAHLRNDCFSKPVYKSHYQAYLRAREDMAAIELDADDRELAEAILATLYLWYEAYLENPRVLSLQDLAQATLRANDVLRAEDAVAYVLSQMQALPQIQFDNNSAQFIPAGDEGPRPVTLFKDFVRRVQGQRYEVERTWSNALFFSTQETRSTPGLYNEFPPDTPTARAFEYRSLQYSGQAIVAARWLDDWSLELHEDDVHFRVILLTGNAAQPITPAQLNDTRIAVIQPGALSDETLRAAAEYLAWQRMSEEYKNQSGKDADTINAWLEDQKSTVTSNLLNTQLAQYRTGQIITRNDLGISVKDAFGAASNDKRLGFIVEKLLASAYPQIPVETNALRGTLTSAEVGKVFEGYFSKDPAGAQTAATRNYGVGLGLSSSDMPSRLAPQENNVVLKRIAEMLTEKQGGELAVWKVYQALSNPPFGLPYVVIQLYLLAFVRQNNPRVELMLKRDHKLKTREGRNYPRDRITAATVTEIQWKPGLHTVFDSLAPAAGPTWNDTLPYARILVNDLHTTTDQQEIEAESARLDDKLAALSADVPKQRNALAVLERTLNGTLPDASKQTLSQLEALGELQNGFAAFYEQAQEIFKSPEALRDNLHDFERLRDLAAIAAEVSEVKRYLEMVRLRESDTNLNANRTSLLGRLTLNNLASQPHVWGAMRADFEQFKSRYRNEYQKHHRDTNNELNKLRDALAGTPRQLNALRLLNSISQLGPARGEDLGVKFEEINARLKPCSVTDYQTVAVDAAPVCEKCGRDLLYAPPVEAVNQFRRSLENALKQRQGDLSSVIVRRVTERQGDALDKILDATQGANVSALVEMMDDNVVTLIRQLLEQDNIVAAEGDVIQRFLQQYGSLEEADIPQAVAAFEKLLHAAFETAKQKNAGSKNIRLTLR